MTRAELFRNIKAKQSYLCIGLDTDIQKIPKHLLQTEDPVFEFNRQIIEATKEFAVAYKPNLAFYESMGPAGLASLAKTMKLIPDNIFTIADAKRGDIGNTSDMYAKTFFDYYNFDSVTVAPYMGKDSVIPFLQYENKWVILLVATSNVGSIDFQLLDVVHPGKPPEKLYQHVIHRSADWGGADDLMFVVGATHPELIADVRSMAPEHFFLVPGVGAQGGNLEEISKAGMNAQCGLLVNSSRNILYASNDEDFAEKSLIEAKKIQSEMAQLLDSLI